ncbi:terpene synthase family protein [Streptomyces fumanus]|uniref:Terpene synthase n=1 Tax=Streptomyces fumanus TaxID=67302 RepID=A0A919ABM7_9ACTN|nr:terpene synthase family protein [Streptomyces fumanus]GHE98523.1 hypothetical protein GCM10018772_23690 [Streptomyces fumanus]
MTGRTTPSPIRLDIPPLYIPYATTPHPDYDILTARIGTWLDDLGPRLIPHQRSMLTDYNLPAMACLALPTTSGSDRFALAAQNAILHGYFDMLVLEADPVAGDLMLASDAIARTLQAMDGSVPQRPAGESAEEPPFLAMWTDLAHRVQACLGPLLSARWVNAHRHGWLGHLRHTAYSLAGAQPTLDHYVLMRSDSAGGPLIPLLVEMTREPDLSTPLLTVPELRALSQAATLLIGWDNDIFSYAREHALGRPPHPDEAPRRAPVNLVDLLLREHHCTLPEAFDQAVRLRDQVMCLFVRLSEKYLPTARDDVRTYVADLGQMIRGYAEYLLTPHTTYHRKTDSIEPDQDPHALSYTFGHGGLTAERSEPTNHQPLPYPSIRWWWDLLDT